MSTTKEFLAALVAVRDEQTEQTVGVFTFRPDNRGGRGFSYDKKVMLVDPFGPPRIETSSGGMRNWPADSGMRRIAKRYADANAAELQSREEIAT